MEKAKVFNVSVTLKDGDGKAHKYEGTVEYAKTPNDYGNGYHMAVKIPRLEAFNIGVYDIRYDNEFESDNMIGYFANFYGGKFTGKNGAWRLVSISIEEAE